MNARRELERICRRHGVPYARGARLLPLVERAAQARGELRASLLAVVDATLARDAEELSRRDRGALLSLASLLHGWGER